MNTVHKILSIFEDFLEDKGMWIENEDRTGDEGEAILYGMDYGRLYEEINALLATEQLILDGDQFVERPLTPDVEKILRVVKDAIKELGSNNVNVSKNPETEMYDVMVCTLYESFPYMSSVGRVNQIDEDELERELDKLGICLMSWW